MKRSIGLALFLIIVTAAAASAQGDKPDGGRQRRDGPPHPELGFRSGLSIYQLPGEGSENLTTFSFPGTGVEFSPAMIYLAWFAMQRLAVEPQLGFSRSSQGDFSSTSIGAGLQANQFLGDPWRAAPYLFLNLALARSSYSFGDDDDDSDSENYLAFGGGAGYRAIMWKCLTARFEARYRRIMPSEDNFDSFNEFSVQVGLGAILRGMNF